MSSSDAALRKILEHEARQGYADKAVIGGLDRFMQNWNGLAAENLKSRKQLRSFKKLYPSGFSYAALSPEARAKWVKSLLELLESAAAEPIEPPQPAPKAAARKKPAPKPAGSSLDTEITVIKGVSTSLAGAFHKLGVKTVRDMLYFFPHRHLDYSQRTTISRLNEAEDQTIIANVWQVQATLAGNRRSTEAILGDETGNIRVIWYNNPYIAKTLKTNDRVIISGKVGMYKGRHVFQSPEWEVLEDRELLHTGRLVPLYHLTRGLYPRQVRKIAKEAIEQWAGRLADFLPAPLREHNNLLDLPRAITQAHFPDSLELKDRARVRLAFDELILLQLGALYKKRAWSKQKGNPLPVDLALLSHFKKSLPFALTDAQEKVLGEILIDMAQSCPMSRLLQGDVGSGKTVVAAMALLTAVSAGLQGAMMAPTEILAEQHFATLSQLFGRAGRIVEDGPNVRSYAGILPDHTLTLGLLVGEVKQSNKSALQKSIADGSIDILVGTHALIQKGVKFQKLGLAVVDEQHRFGVTQRSALRQQGYNPHMLVMTATPIPRSLALTLYGDLDLSVIDQMPPGRQAIKTKWLKPEQRESAYGFIRRQAAAGHQAFIICPLIQESEAVQARAAVAEYERLSAAVFPELKLGLLHGRMSAAEKDDVMRRFHAAEMTILVATPVVEVGIDVPNATVMLVESADRFGLAQLHQFRGRVGRGPAQSYCLLLAESPSEVGRQRLDIIERVYDGFHLAEEDLKLRGPGEFFGTRQSGLPDLRMAQLSDAPLLEMARRAAAAIFKADPDLQGAAHALLRHEVARVWGSRAGEWS